LLCARYAGFVHRGKRGRILDHVQRLSYSYFPAVAKSIGEPVPEAGLPLPVAHGIPKISVLPVIDSTFVKPAEESLHRLEPLCKDGLEKTVHGLLLDVVQALLVSSREGCHPILDTESMEFIIC
jgi:hypothetical protein